MEIVNINFRGVMIFRKNMIRIGNIIISKQDHLPSFGMRQGYQRYLKIGKWYIFYQNW